MCQKLSLAICFIFCFLFSVLCSLSNAQETLTITTYYPSPYGSYRDLTVANNLRLEATPLAADGPQIEWRTGSARHWNIDQFNDQLRFFTEDTNDANGVVRVTITEAGNVGIGTTAPNGKLTIDAPDTTVAPSLSIHNGGNAWGWDFDSEIFATGRLDLYAINSGVRSLVMSWARSTGNVGIRKNDPNYPLDVNGVMRAERYRGINSWVLNNFQTVNPSSNVYLYSPANDRDSWIFLDSADTGSNWGIYHRQIDAVVNGLPDNAIGFIGGGSSALNSYISLRNGDAYFRGNVGIGKTDPNYKLDVAGTVRLGGFTGNNADEWPNLVWYRDLAAGWDEGLIKGSSARGVWGRTGYGIHMDANRHFMFASSGWNTLVDIEGGTGRMYIRGDVGIGAPVPGYKLDVAGEVHASGHPTSSDMRFKKNIKPISDVLDKVNRLHAVSFEWNERYEKMGRATKGRQIGIVAQEIEKQFPELVSNWGDGSDYRGVDYGRFAAVLLEAVKELKSESDTLKQRIKMLESRLSIDRKQK